jgi:hypothetical protein
MDMKIYNTLLFIFFICFLEALGTRPDPCTLPANIQLSNGVSVWGGNTTTLADCFNSIPFDSNRSSLTITVLRQLAELYSFTDIARNSGPPWNMQVDLIAGLNTIASNFPNYTSDYHFHEDIIRLFTSLYDGHTVYFAPLPYYNCILIAPFSLYAINNGGQLQVFLEPGVVNSSLFLSLTGFNSTPYFDQELVQVNNQSVLSWLQEFANRYVGTFKDPTIRTASLFQFLGRYSIVSLGAVPFNELLQPDNFTIGTSVVSVPKAALCLPNTNTSSWIQAIDTPLPSNYKKRSILYRSLVRHTQFDIHRKRRQDLENVMGPLNPPEFFHKRTNAASTTDTSHRSVANTQTVQIPLVIGSPSRLQIKGQTQADDSAWYGIYTDSHGNVYSFLKLQSFYPANQTDFLIVLNNWIVDYTTNSYSNVIVDVSKNGGGFICFALLLESILVPQWVTGQVVGNTSLQVWEPYDLRESNITDGLLSAGYFSLNEFCQLDGIPYSNNSWYSPGVIRTRGNVTGNFSEQLIYPYECSVIFGSSIPYFPPNIIIITEGTCASACSLFVTKFQKYGRATVVSHGGLPGVDMDSSSVAGGDVLSWNEFISSLSSLPSFSNEPIQMPTSAYASFNQFEMYMGLDATTPREWNKFPTDYHLLWWDAVYYDNLNTSYGQQAVATLYESVVNGVRSVPLPTSPLTTSPNVAPTSPVNSPAISPPLSPPTKPNPSEPFSTFFPISSIAATSSFSILYLLLVLSFACFE